LSIWFPVIISLPLPLPRTRPDILSLLPDYLQDVEDYLSLIFTCRLLRSAVSTTTSSSHTLLRLCHASRRTFFRHDPHFLLTALSPAHFPNGPTAFPPTWLSNAPFSHGIEAVINLCISIPSIADLARWSLQKFRDLWEWRMRVANPISDLLDKCIGDQWFANPTFWNGGVSDALLYTHVGTGS